MYDLAVIGLGPAGLEAVDIALKNNLKVIAFEKNEPGGTCLNVGCIPTKALLYSSKMYSKMINSSKLGIEIQGIDFSFDKMIERKNNIISKFTKILNSDLSKRITLIKHEAELWIDENDLVISCEDNLYKAKNIIIATGSKPIELTELKFDGNFILSSDDLFSLVDLPKSITIVGSGAIGLEWAYILSNLGVDVNIVEKAKNIAPLLDVDIQKRIERILKSNKVKIYKDDYIISAKPNEIILNSNIKLESDVILSAVGRKPVLPSIKVSGCSEEYKINVNDDFSTEFYNLFVIGDAKSDIMLAHCASYQAKTLMDMLLYNKKQSRKTIPSVVYLSPEIACCGINGQDIDDTYTVKSTLLSRVAKSWCDEANDGMIKLILKDNKLKGAHLVCPEASILVTFLSYFIDKNIDISELEDIIYPHPSYSELLLEVLKSE